MSTPRSTTVVFATCQVEGIHRWANAPEKYKYLSYPHRHVFHARVCVEVGHNNRDVEFIDLKHMLQECFEVQAFHGEALHATRSFHMLDFRSKSCEMLASGIACCFVEEGYRVTEIEVNEDGENGAVIRYDYTIPTLQNESQFQG